MNEIEEIITELCIKYGEKVLNKFESMLKKSVNKHSAEAIKKLNNIWQEAVSNYYGYPTGVYIRHGNVSVGSGGSNLYNALQADFTDGIITINIDSSQMDTSSRIYKGLHGKVYGYLDDAETVVDTVLDGNRFREYDSYTVSAGSYNGTLNEVLDACEKDLTEEIGDKILDDIITFFAKYYT